MTRFGGFFIAQNMRPPNRFELTEAEKQSLLWRRLVDYLLEENQRDREANDNISLDVEQTRNLRAMIAARNSLLELDQ